jgi:hypothetical protein
MFRYTSNPAYSKRRMAGVFMMRGSGQSVGFQRIPLSGKIRHSDTKALSLKYNQSGIPL